VSDRSFTPSRGDYLRIGRGPHAAELSRKDVPTTFEDARGQKKGIKHRRYGRKKLNTGVTVRCRDSLVEGGENAVKNANTRTG